MIQAGVLFLAICLFNTVFIDFVSTPIEDDAHPIGGVFRIPVVVDMHIVSFLSIILCHEAVFQSKKAKRIIFWLLAVATIGLLTEGKVFFIGNILFDVDFRPLKSDEAVVQSSFILAYVAAWIVNIINNNVKYAKLIYGTLVTISGVVATHILTANLVFIWHLVIASYVFLILCKTTEFSNNENPTNAS